MFSRRLEREAGPRYILLLKSWKHPYRSKPYAIGTVLQTDDELGTKLIKDKIGEEWKGPYPPKEKRVTELFKPKT